MKILVTGGAGFIGSCFIRHVLSKHDDYEVINLDKLTYAGNIENLDDIKNDKRYTFIKGDICDKEIVNEITKNVDCVVNFAAESHVDRSIEGPEVFIETNVKGTLNLLQFSLKNKVQRYLQVSVFGKRRVFLRNNALITQQPLFCKQSGGGYACSGIF